MILVVFGEPDSDRGQNATPCYPWLAHFAFLYTPHGHLPSNDTAHRELSLSKPTITQTYAPRACPRANLMGAFSQLRVPLLKSLETNQHGGVGESPAKPPSFPPTPAGCRAALLGHAWFYGGRLTDVGTLSMQFGDFITHANEAGVCGSTPCLPVSNPNKFTSSSR